MLNTNSISSTIMNHLWISWTCKIWEKDTKEVFGEAGSNLAIWSSTLISEPSCEEVARLTHKNVSFTHRKDHFAHILDLLTTLSSYNIKCITSHRLGDTLWQEGGGQRCKLCVHPVGLQTSSRILKVYPSHFVMNKTLKVTPAHFRYIWIFFGLL